MDYGVLIKSILLQIVVFSAVPFLYWVLRKRKEQSFFCYVGLCKPHRAAAIQPIAIFVTLYIVVYSVVHFTPIAALTQPSAGMYAGLGSAAVLSVAF